MFSGFMVFLSRYIQVIVLKLKCSAKPSVILGDDLESYKPESILYIAAEIDARVLADDSTFTVGDGKIYQTSRTQKSYENVKLQQDTCYSVVRRSFKRRVSNLIILSCHFI